MCPDRSVLAGLLGVALLAGRVEWAKAQASHCPAAAASGIAARAELQLSRRVQRRDTTIDVVVCVRAADSKVRIGSLNAELRYDSLDAQVLLVTRLAGGMQMENANDAGRIRFAAVAPSGLDPSGAVLRVRLRMRRPGRVPWVDLLMLEVNSADGKPLLANTRVAGLRESPKRPLGAKDEDADEEHERRPAVRAPEIDSLSPRAAARLDGQASQVQIRGKNFTDDDNTVWFGEVALTHVRSLEHGTLIRFTVPQTMSPDGGEAPPRPLGPGAYQVRVETSAGRSATREFLITVNR
jgi:hypothetical protein